MVRGWFGDRKMHSLASKGIRSSMLRRKGLVHRADDTWDYRQKFIENFGYYNEKEFEQWLIDMTGKAPFKSDMERPFLKSPSPIPIGMAHGEQEVNENNLVDYIIGYETGENGAEDTLKLFSYLIKTGKAWTLQGHYGRRAKMLIDDGYINKDGEINWEVLYD